MDLDEEEYRATRGLDVNQTKGPDVRRIGKSH